MVRERTRADKGTLYESMGPQQQSTNVNSRHFIKVALIRNSRRVYNQDCQRVCYHRSETKRTCLQAKKNTWYSPCWSHMDPLSATQISLFHLIIVTLSFQYLTSMTEPFKITTKYILHFNRIYHGDSFRIL